MKKLNAHKLYYLAGFTSLLFLLSNTSAAQEKLLKAVHVKQKRNYGKLLNDERVNSFAPGMKMLAIDSQMMEQYALQNLNNLLSQQVPVFIKSYGINSLATLNFRGSSSAQSQVLWNGIPLNNASLGMADISILSVHYFDNIHILYGGSSALTGSGNVGAALLLNNRFEPKDSTKKTNTLIAAEAGSFHQYKIALQHQFTIKKLFVSLNASGQTAQNNFDYKNQKNEVQKMQHARLHGFSGLLHLGYTPGTKTQLHFSAWYQHFNRQLPAALFEKFSAKEQTDESIRIFFEAKKTMGRRSKIYTKTAFIHDAMHYEDSSVHLVSSNKTFQLYEETGWKKEFSPQHKVLLFLPVNISWTRPLNDSQTRFQNKLAVAAAYTFSNKAERLNVAVNTRLEQINRQTVFLPGLNASYVLSGFLTVRANIQKSYRAPTLNEWYFLPGGNQLLKPERGWSQDIGYALKFKLFQKAMFTHDVSLFNRNIKDWILWFGGSIWTPHNIAKVHSRGIESVNSLMWEKHKLKFHIGLNTSFVLATTQQSYIPGDGSIGKQIPYSPRYNLQGNLGADIGSININYNHNYIGYRFVTTDESQYLVPYQTGNLYLSFQKNIRLYQWKISLQCNNIWNKTYQVVYLRPMPARNMAIAISCGF